MYRKKKIFRNLWTPCKFDLSKRKKKKKKNNCLKFKFHSWSLLKDIQGLQDFIDTLYFIMKWIKTNEYERILEK